MNWSTPMRYQLAQPMPRTRASTGRCVPMRTVPRRGACVLGPARTVAPVCVTSSERTQASREMSCACAPAEPTTSTEDETTSATTHDQRTGPG
jgi:hypothetical protein